jgi:hypothetical protein
MTRVTTALAALTDQYRTANRTPKDRTRGANSTESDKGAFVRRCLGETPTMRNTDIQRKAREQGITISPAYISEIRKAFFGEQTAWLTERTDPYRWAVAQKEWSSSRSKR